MIAEEEPPASPSSSGISSPKEKPTSEEKLAEDRDAIREKKERAAAAKRMKEMNFVRAPHHVAPIDGVDTAEVKRKLDSLSSDPFAKKKLVGK